MWEIFSECELFIVTNDAATRGTTTYKTKRTATYPREHYRCTAVQINCLQVVWNYWELRAPEGRVHYSNSSIIVLVDPWCTRCAYN